MKNSIIVTAVFLLLFWSCSSPEENKKNDNADSLKTETQNTETQAVELSVSDFKVEMAAGLKLDGEIVHGETWTDNRGENMLVFTEKQTYDDEVEGPAFSEYALHVYHYIKNVGKYELQGEEKDAQGDCGFENRARFMEEAVTITDLDKNGHAEMTFVYRLGCSSEASPDDLRLIMYENDKKFTISGNTNVRINANLELGGEMKTSADFDNAPKEFKTYAEKIMTEQQNHNLWWNPRLFVMQRFLKEHLNRTLIGTEPFWDIKIHDGYLIYTSNIGEPKIRYNIAELIEHENEYRLDAIPEDNDRRLSLYLTIEKKECNDGMSDKKFPYSVKLSQQGNERHGCGKQK